MGSMRRILCAVVFLVAGCSPSALTQVVDPAKVTAPPAPVSTSSVVASPTALPTPSVLALSEAYLVVANKYNHGRDVQLSYSTAGWKLSTYREWCGEWVRITDAFVAGMSKIPFTTAAMKRDAAALIKESKQEAAAFRKCTVAKTLATVKKSAATVDRLTPSGTAAAQRLREDLGLPTR